MRVFLTGSSGFVGHVLVRRLLELSADIVCLDRIDNGKNYRINNELTCDLTNLSDDEIEEIYKFDGVVIHLAAARTDDASLATYKKDNIHATNELLRSLNPEKIKGFVHISSVAAIDGRILYENDVNLLNSDDYYRYTKYLQEQLVVDWCNLQKVNCIVLQPSAIYDETFRLDTNIGKLIRIANLIPFMPVITNKKSLTPMQLIIDAIVWSTYQVKAQKLQEGFQKKYVVVERPILNVTQIVQRLTEDNIKIIHVPGFKYFLHVFANVASILKIFRIHLPLTKGRIEKLYSDTSYDDFCEHEIWENYYD